MIRSHAAAVALAGDAAVVGVWEYPDDPYGGVVVRFHVGRVAETTREGRILTWWPASAEPGTDPCPLPTRASGVWVIPAAGYDIDGVLAVAQQWVRFASHAEMLAAFTPCKKTGEASES